jgi:DNA-binding beta-propeller fold protein YncE
MRAERPCLAASLALLIAACGGSGKKNNHATTATRATAHATATPPRHDSPPQALVTDETQNRLLIVDLPSGRVSRRVKLPADPEDIATIGNGGVVVVVSSRAGTVTALDRDTLRRIRTFGGFDEPHIVAISPDGQHAYVTDDALGTVTAIRLSDMQVTSIVRVGAGAHHVTFSPDQQRAWVALGEAASRIAILDTTNVEHPRVIGYFKPGFPAHDLSFNPSGRQVWVTSASGPDVTAFDAASRRALFRVPAGAPPQHIDFEGSYAYLTSGYGGMIEKVDAATGRVITRSSAPYGSFELAADDGYVVTSSLLRGTLAIYTPDLRRLRIVTIAPSAREVAISRP